jgi:anti-sigma B factor antagonist
LLQAHKQLKATLATRRPLRERDFMKLQIAELDHGISKILLDGRLDLDGALAIDAEFKDAVAGKRRIVVDLAGVDYLASLGIRTLVSGAKTAAGIGGKLVVLAPQRNVEKVLRESNIDTLIPIIRDIAEVDLVFGL